MTKVSQTAKGTYTHRAGADMWTVRSAKAEWCQGSRELALHQRRYDIRVSKGSVLDSHYLGQSSIACYLPNTSSTGLFLAAKSLIRALFDRALFHLGYSY